MYPKPNAVINALKRLERAGQEDSRATEKIKAAALAVAAHVLALVPERVDRLPRGFAIGRRPSGERCLITPFNAIIVADLMTRDIALALADDIAGGWLDDLADFLNHQSDHTERLAAYVEEEIAKHAATKAAL